ncbi:MAG: hypothetical protein D6B26_06740, partial [Spirochaetaceae bacterium]
MPVRSSEILDSLLDADEGMICHGCGLTYSQVRAAGRLGCEHCLDSFADELAASLLSSQKRLEHSLVAMPYHSGDLPDKLRQMSVLLGIAVAAEDEIPAVSHAENENINLSWEWHESAGSADDVVACSRVVCSRSVADLPLGHYLSQEEARKIAINCGLQASNFSRQDRLILREKLYIDQRDDSPALAVWGKRASIVIGGQEQLRTISVASGLSLETCLEASVAEMKDLEQSVQVRARVDFGYVNSSIGLLGDGVQLVVVLHLWALDILGGIDAVRQGCRKDGLFFRRLPGGFFQLISNGSLGVPLADRHNLLESQVVALV